MTQNAEAGVVDGPAREGGTLKIVQVMRGIAAIAVAFYHTHMFVSRPALGDVQTWGAVVSFGWLGVGFFFVLSGFIILLAHAKDIGKPDRAGRYIWRRFSRVYPIYWVFLSLYLFAAWFGFGSHDFSWAPRNLASAYALVQIGAPPTLPLRVAWTLFYEIAFYRMFLALILSRFWGGLLVATWLAAIVLSNGLAGPQALWYLHAWNLYFPVGAAAWLAFTRIAPRHGPLLFAIGLGPFVLVLASGFVSPLLNTFQQEPLRLLTISLPLALILLGGALSERHYGWRMPFWALLLGEASFSIYLTHSAAISVLAVVVARFAPGLPGWIHFLLVVTPAIAAGLAAHLFVERPLLKVVRRASPFTVPRVPARAT